MCLGITDSGSGWNPIGSGSGCTTKQWIVISLVTLSCVVFIISVTWWSYCKIRSYYKNRPCTRKSQHGDNIAEEPLPSPADEAESPPLFLWVDSPNGMRCCDGEYKLVVKDGCNQLMRWCNHWPCWLKKDGSRLIVSGSDGHWHIARHGGSSHFTGEARLICSQVPHNGVFPHKVAGGWAIKRNFRWRVDPDIAVQALAALFMEDPVPIDPEMPAVPEIDFRDQAAMACSKSIMCSIGDVSGFNSRFLQELVAPPGVGEAVQWQSNSELSTTASVSEISTRAPCSVTDSGLDKVDTATALSYQKTGLQYLAQTVAKAPSQLETCPALRNSARPVDPPAQRQLPPRLPPQVLRVFVPFRQTSCSGLYVLVPDEQPNGRPLWRLQAPGPEHWLFCSSSGLWSIGGADVQRECFTRDAGYVTQTWPSDPDVFPHECETIWQLWDSHSNMFQEVSAIEVTEADPTSWDHALPIIHDASSCVGGCKQRWSLSKGHSQMVADDQASFPANERSWRQVS